MNRWGMAPLDAKARGLGKLVFDRWSITSDSAHRIKYVIPKIILS